ncbi:MAG: CHAT domain-containing protein [Hydrococcus sp. SU_1_0]|nr:CHAT domain-containing protein [Hydrococcus sp. SU_1_0]
MYWGEWVNEADRLAYLEKTNTAVVNMIILDNKTYAVWQLPNGKFRKYVINISQNQLNNLITQWRFDLENKENDNYLALSQQLYKLLLPPKIESYLKTSGIKNLVFVNDGILRNVPMAALHDGENFLVEDYAITNSLGLIIRAKDSNPKIEKVTAFGLTIGINQFPPLPYVEQEINQLAEIVEEEQFLNDEFTKSNFKKQIESSKSPLIHVATHGRFSGNLENSFLQAYQSQINLPELESILSDRSLNFPNNPIELMVLSACDTAAGDPRATLGMSGVAVRAGVSNVLGSLWSVNDRQIVSLIDGFYNNWIQNRLSQSEALRQAQLDLINSHDYHPSNWSSMILLQ